MVDGDRPGGRGGVDEHQAVGSLRPGHRQLYAGRRLVVDESVRIYGRVGTERSYVFHGKSRICSPLGETLVQGPVDEEAILLATIDVNRARTKRIERRGEDYSVDRIHDRRPDLYET